jgi:hypothetical protein
MARAAVSAWAALVTLAGTSAMALAAPTADGDIRDIRGPVPIPPWWRWPLAALAGAVAIGILVVLFRRWREHARRPLSPLERARKALEAAEALARAGDFRACAEILAETLRAALAVRLGAGVLPQTTAELRHGPWTKPPLSLEIEADTILALLETCDLARFARAKLDSNALLEATAMARALTERLHAPPPPPRPAKAPSLAQTVTP